LKRIASAGFAAFLVIAVGCSRYQTDIQPLPKQGPEVSPTLAQSTEKRVLKRKVAIGRFSNETKYGKGIFSDPSVPDIGKQAMDILSAKLAETGKFLLLERADLELI
jgi:curli biogenesis system outer membrane secretion channel CsgG